MSIKRKLHHLISGQIPDFVQAEYPQFVTFLEHYYKFLENENQVHDVFLNSADWNDIDLTLDAFVPYFRNQFSYDIPSTAIIENRKLIKYINQYYESKGSETATEMFFRIMFNDTARVSYPGDYILRASDGRWQRRRYIKVETSLFSDENIYEISEQEITLRYLEFVPGAGDVEKVVTTRCFDVIQTARPNIYQLEVDINPNYVFPDYISVDLTLAPSLGKEDTHVYIQYDGKTYGTVTKQLISINEIVTEGSRFARDDAYFISETGVEGPYFAGDYSENLGTPLGYAYETIQNNAVVRVSETVNTLLQPGSPSVQGQIKQLQIVDTGERFFARDNNGDPVNTFTINLSSLSGGGTTATITFNTGLIYHAQGEFKDNSGFLSDIVKLQDGNYYQPYSYVIETTIPQGNWRTSYLNSTHPAGFKMFSELLLVDTITETATIVDSFYQNKYFLEITDSVDVSESKSISYVTSKSDSLTVSEDEVILFQGNYSDSITVSEDDVKEFDKFETEIISITESPAKDFSTFESDNITVSESAIPSLIIFRNFSDNISVAENSIFEFDLSKSENITITEDAVFDVDIVFSDSATVSDDSSIEFFLPTSDSITTNDSTISYNFDQRDDLTSDLQDDITISDVHSISYVTSFTDSISLAESVETSLFLQQIAQDSITISETSVYDFDKSLIDAVSVTEQFTYDFDQQNDATSDLTDEVTVSDEISIDFARSVSDAIDVIDKSCDVCDAGIFSFNKNVFDNITTNDQLRYTFNQNNDATSDLKEDIVISEVVEFAIDKELSDALTISENAVPVRVFLSSLSDNVTINVDNTVINTNKSLSDSASTSDEGGSLFTENYVENPSSTAGGYFDEYYVGTLTSF